MEVRSEPSGGGNLDLFDFNIYTKQFPVRMFHSILQSEVGHGRLGGIIASQNQYIFGIHQRFFAEHRIDTLQYSEVDILIGERFKNIKQFIRGNLCLPQPGKYFDGNCRNPGNL
mgnify:CR=1 FL=1